MGEKPAVHHRPAAGSQHGEAPQLPLCRPEQEEEGSGKGGQPEAQVQPGGQTGQQAAEGAQQIVHHGGAGPQQDGLAEEQQLPGDHHPHAIRTGG